MAAENPGKELQRTGGMRLQTKFGISLSALVILTSALLSVSLYLISGTAVEEGVRRRLRNTVGTAAAQIDGDKHARIRDGADESGPEYAEIRSILQHVKSLDADIGYIETVRLDDQGRVLFVVDADTTEMKVRVGEVYDTVSPIFVARADTLASVWLMPDLYTDEWGTWLSGYAPIRRPDGTREGFLAVDISNAQVRKYQRRFLRIALTIFVAMAVTSPFVGFWIGGRMARSIVLLTEGARRIADGHLESKVHVDTGDEVEDLAIAFNRMTDELQVYIANLAEATAAKERIESELRIATEIQASMLPRIFPAFPDLSEFDIYATMEPAKEVGGDFYDFFLVGDRKLCFVIGDVTGKGVPASLFMVISKTLIKTEALRGIPPNEVLHRVNEALFPDNDSMLFVTVLCIVLDLDTGELHYANGGHNPPLLCRGDQDFEFVELPRNPAVGPLPGSRFDMRQDKMNPGDVFFMYTDGVSEAMNVNRGQFTAPRIRQCLSALRDRSVDSVLHAVRREVAAFSAGAEQWDDITMLAVRYNGKGR